jgi:hypothetical protein
MAESFGIKTKKETKDGDYKFPTVISLSNSKISTGGCSLLLVLKLQSL